MMQGFVKIGKITKAHGLQGQVKIHSYAENPLDIKGYSPLFDVSKKQYNLKKAKMAGKAVLATIEGVVDRNASEALIETELYVPESKLDSKAAEDEIFYKDIIGLTVFDEKDSEVGTVKAVHNFGAGDVLEVLGEKEFMLPFEMVEVMKDKVVVEKYILEQFK